MVGLNNENGVMSPLEAYNRIRILTRQLLLSQVPLRIRAPKKRWPRMQPPPEQETKPRVCRRLFADDPEPSDPDHDGVRDNMLNQISEETNRDLDEVCKKYNFDFRTEEPLEGNWEWERFPSDTPQNQPDEDGDSPTAPGEDQDQGQGPDATVPQNPHKRDVL